MCITYYPMQTLLRSGHIITVVMWINNKHHKGIHWLLQFSGVSATGCSIMPVFVELPCNTLLNKPQLERLLAFGSVGWPGWEDVTWGWEIMYQLVNQIEYDKHHVSLPRPWRCGYLHADLTQHIPPLVYSRGNSCWETFFCRTNAINLTNTSHFLASLSGSIRLHNFMWRSGGR